MRCANALNVLSFDVKQLLKDAAARLGFHVVRNYQNPAHTLMGLGRYDIRTVIDVGANSGQFARYIRAHLPSAAVHCFEPMPRAFAELTRWTQTQRGVIPVQIALGDEAGSAEMHMHTEHSPSSSLLETSDHCKTLYPFTSQQEKVSVRLERLDDYVRQLALPLVRDVLLKLDVQGFEGAVLRGAPVTLSSVRACIAEVSLEVLYIGQSTFPEILNHMTVAGLRYAGNMAQKYGADGRVIYLDAVFVRDDDFQSKR